eukprot:CAMPEP_0172519696 /NCGR_PEP_ID=MMETSP1066-20121228/291570_1 /TAXON_ID=671091 /ORGANISM="Coscinodiscus wailesii, Strain CCMP2513" /LENGTH=622 /DNA_ID=CAMNT_0013302329 /DNA_START=204 /DNA_END=2072 /DNA_ORIENTATION=-
MEELHDAIEDAQYVSAISIAEGVRPVIAWDTPTEEQLEEWYDAVFKKYGDASFTPEWYLANPVAFYLFSSFVKYANDDYHRMNFIEYVCRYRNSPARLRAHIARKVASAYLTPTTEEDLPHLKHIKMDEYDVARRPPAFSAEEVKALCEELSDPSNERCCVGLAGNKVDDVVEKSERKPPPKTSSNGDSEGVTKWTGSGYSALFPENLFDELEIVVYESLKQQYWDLFLESDEKTRADNLLWYNDRKAKKEDFFEMRVLGRGGFGLVTACKKGTSGKLYAMKVMNKKRIKMKKAEQLTLNERNALAAVHSPFVIELNYSLQTKNDVFLILDLMTGGDLSFHLMQKGSFSQRETLYYSARIMLGLQALHDNGFVYRDLKPENCLLDEDGRVKITDLGLAVKIHPKLSGAAGTRGYWAPEMLRRDSNGKRICYNHAVDWFSFGCLLAEFISGINPFRTDEALKFGKEKTGTDNKEKAIDCATLEMDPPFETNKMSDKALDLCRKLLDKNPETRLGAKGSECIKSHAFFEGLDWEQLMTDRLKPPFRPAKDVNAASQSEIGQFNEGKAFQETVLDEKDQQVYKDWDYVNKHSQTVEVIEFLVYEQQLGKPLLPPNSGNACCCAIS